MFELAVADVAVASPPAGVLELRLAGLVDAPVDAPDKTVLFEFDEAVPAFEVARAELCVDELPDFEEGLSVATEPFELPALLPEVDFAEVPAIDWS